MVSHCSFSLKAWFLFIYLLAVLGLCCCWLFSSFGELRLLSGCIGAWASLCSGISYSRAWALRLTGFSSGSSRVLGTDSIVVVLRLGCFVACGIFLDQGLNPCLLLITTEPPGKPLIAVLNCIFWWFMMLCIFSRAYFSFMCLWRNVC